MDGGTNTILLFYIEFHTPIKEEWHLTVILNLPLRTLFKSENSKSCRTEYSSNFVDGMFGRERN